MRWIATWHCSACAVLPRSRRTWSAGSVPNRHSAATLPDRRDRQIRTLIRRRSERSLATIPPTMKALMAALHSFQLASLQRRSGRYVEVGERAIIRSSTYILEGRARLNIFKDPPFSILKLCHFGRLVYFEIEIIQKRLDRHVTSNLI